MKIGIIGCGLIGQKRSKAIDADDEIVRVADTIEKTAQKFGEQWKCPYTTNWKEVIDDPHVDAVVIATFHNALAEITGYAIQAKKHVLVEKPAARNAVELKPVVDQYIAAQKKSPLIVKAGFNHRFHPAMWKAKELIDTNEFGPILFIRGRYGHGGRIGYDKEWRADKEISGGGELLDQGMHLIDLSRWYMGDFTKVSGTTKTYFWDMKVDDNAFMTLETSLGQTAFLHVTWTEWKNLFSLEIYCKTAKFHIEGLGGSYGMEKLSFYKMKPEMGPPDTQVFEFPGEDISWKAEWKNFKDSIAQKTKVVGDIIDAFESLKIVGKVYEFNHQ